MIRNSWIIKDLLKVTSDFLKSKQIESPRLCAEILLAFQLDTERLKLYLEYDQPIGESDINSYRSMLKRLVQGEPIQYITGIQEFWSLEFQVNKNVLIPRPETEILIEQALKIYREEYYEINSSPVIIDVGTGSGAIAVSLACELKSTASGIWASDISRSALDTAINNAKNHGVMDMIEFIQGDLFEPLKNKGIKFDFILSNPPYVTAEEYDSLPCKIRNFEPRIALDGRDDGLFYIKKLISQAGIYLKPGGWLGIEMAPGQISQSIDLLDNIKSYDRKQIIKDYSNKDRVVLARREK